MEQSGFPKPALQRQEPSGWQAPCDEQGLCDPPRHSEGGGGGYWARRKVEPMSHVSPAKPLKHSHFESLHVPRP